MSEKTRIREKRTASVWNSLTEDEKQDMQQWCSISDELIRDRYPGQDVDSVVERMTDAAFAEFMRAVIARHRKRKKQAAGEAVKEDEHEIYNEEIVVENE